MGKNKFKKNVNSKAQQKADIAVEAFVKSSSYNSDPYGCYTGKPKDDDKVPTQDADDI